MKTWRTKVSHPGRGANRPARTASADLECWGSRGNKDPRHPPNHLPGGGIHANLGLVDVVTLQEVICEPGGEFKRLDPRHGEASFGVER